MPKLNKIRKKLDKNKDGLISLDEYLADDESKGPRESRGRIGYHYQHFANIINYFKIVMRGFRKFKILCVPNFVVRYGNYVDKTAIVINVKDESLIYGTRMREAINDCMVNKSARFIFFTLILRFRNMNHANIVVIDLEKETLERFEPHGATFFFDKNSQKDNKNVNNIMEETVLPDLGLDNFTYLAPQKISPFSGVQMKADAYCGMCVTISMMYLHLRILNPDIKQLKLIKFMLNRSKEKLKKMILKYAKHVEETLKDNENYVMELFDEVIDELDF